jgi:hypothetical protein
MTSTPPPPPSGGPYQVPPPPPGAPPPPPNRTKPRRWPLWVGLGVLAFVLLGVVGALTDTGDDERSEPNKIEADAPATTATLEATTTTTAAPTTTSTMSPEQMVDVAKLAFGVVFDAQRVELAEAVQGDINVGSVDLFAYDGNTGVVTLDITSGWASPDNQVDGAWDLTRQLAALYSPTDGAWYQAEWVPGFTLVNSGVTYRCSGEFMARLATFSASRADWDAEC